MSSILGTPDIPARTERIDTGDQRTVMANKDTVVRAGDLVRSTSGDEYLDQD